MRNSACRAISNWFCLPRLAGHGIPFVREDLSTRFSRFEVRAKCRIAVHRRGLPANEPASRVRKSPYGHGQPIRHEPYRVTCRAGARLQPRHKCYWRAKEDHIYLLTLYAKGVKDDLTAAERAAWRRAVEAIDND